MSLVWEVNTTRIFLDIFDVLVLPVDGVDVATEVTKKRQPGLYSLEEGGERTDGEM